MVETLEQQLTAMTEERDAVRLRRQELVTMCVQLEGEVNTLHQQLAAMTKAHDTLADQVALDTARIITVVQQYTEAQQEIARLREWIQVLRARPA